MSDAENQTAQIYLITPGAFDLEPFADQLAGVLDKNDIACVRLALANTNERKITHAADTLRAVCHSREVALVIAEHFRLVESHGLDGVHLMDSSRQVRDVRKLLGPDAVIGTYCGASRHAGMTSGEIGADYVSFGPVTQSALGSGKLAEFELFEFWSENIEIPVVAEGNVTLDRAATLAHVVDFFGLGDEVWGTDDPNATLAEYLARIT